MPLDISEDFKIFDGVESVQVVQAGTGKRSLISAALQFGVTARDAEQSNGTYQVGDVKWTLPDVQLKVFKPRPGDFIETAEKVLWSIGAVELLTLKSRHQCWGKRIDLHPETQIKFKIFKPRVLKDPTGAGFTAYKLWKQTTGHIQELASEIDTTDGRRRLKITHQIFIAEQLDCQAGMIVVDAKGSQWNVNRVTNKTSMGVAVTLDVETSRTPLTMD